MLQSILSNVAIILLLHLTMTVVMNFKEKFSPLYINVLMILLISASVISMFYLPIRFNGYWVDMRFIPLIFAAYLQGWKPTIPSLLISSLWRFLMGGEGMIPGILFGLVGPTLFSLAFHSHANLTGKYLEKIGIVIASWLICDLPIIFLVPNGWGFFEDIAFVRSTSFVITSVILYIYIAQNRKLHFLYRELEKLAGEDPLTKLSNKRKFFEVVDTKLAESNSKHYIAMLDIDHFKKFNDTYGHLFGDQVLINIANILKKYENDSVKVGRYGGEEFIIYIGNTANEKAAKIVKKIHQEIQETSFTVEQAPIHITVSIGLAELDEPSSLVHAISQADKNLYKAKDNGRNCLVYSCNS